MTTIPIAVDTSIAVVGAGAMGGGIAQVAAQAGHQVILIDSNQESLDRSSKSLAKELNRMVERGRLSDAEKAAIEGRIVRTTDLADAAGAGLAIEAVVERQDVKESVFAQLAAVMAGDAVLASNTSSLSIDALAARVPGPERFLGLHFFNPVPAMKLVEVVPGARTSPAAVAAVEAAMQRWGKVVARVRDVPGFIVNRVARPYYGEAFAALEDGIPAATIDTIFETAGGFRMGPLTLTDLIGQDVNFGVAENIYGSYSGKTRFRPQPAQRRLADTGKLGRKSGEGVYSYPAGRPEPDFLTPGSFPAPVSISPDAQGFRPLVSALVAEGVAVEEDPTLAPGTLRAGSFVLAMGDGRTLGSRPELDVLVDHLRDFDKASAVAITSRSPAAAEAAAALFERAGKRTLSLPDRPGQLVLRTLAQLANAAADALADEVATAQDIDAAMRFGANHPEGPLEWAQRTGPERVAGILAALAEHDPLYAPAPLLSAGDWP